MRHFMWTMVAGLLLAQAAFSQDVTQPRDNQDGKKPAYKLPPPTPRPPGAAKPGPALAAPYVPGPFQHLNCSTVVFVADDAIGSASLYTNLRDAIEETRAPCVALNVKWFRFDEPRKNYRDLEGQQAAAYRLSCTVLAIRKDAPCARIVFMGHGSGTAVVLAAAEMLPPDSIDRIYLLASSLAPCYYLKPALSASRGGIDAFFSKEDGRLANLVERFGSADGHKGPMAGQVGFVIPPMPLFVGTGKEKVLNPDIPIYRNLRQVGWTGEMTGAGQGGHNSFIRLRFLRNEVVPQLLTMERRCL